MPERLRVAVLASGNGSDFQSIIDSIKRGGVNAQIVLLVTENPEARAIQRAKQNNIKVAVVPRAEYASRQEHDRGIKRELDSVSPDLVVLAGYMRVIRDAGLLEAYAGRMINIHPSLLPAFPGAHAQEDAFKAGETVSGYTVHFVDEGLDAGPIILQERVDISSCKSVDEVKEKIVACEHVGLPKIVQMFAEGSFTIDGRRVKYIKRDNEK